RRRRSPPTELGQRHVHRVGPCGGLVRGSGTAGRTSIRLQQQPSPSEPHHRYRTACVALPQRRLARSDGWKAMTAEREAILKRFAACWFAGLLLLTTASAQPARRRFSLDFGWKFTLGDPPQAERTN